MAELPEDLIEETDEVVCLGYRFRLPVHLQPEVLVVLEVDGDPDSEIPAGAHASWYVPGSDMVYDAVSSVGSGEEEREEFSGLDSAILPLHPLPLREGSGAILPLSEDREGDRVGSMGL